MSPTQKQSETRLERSRDGSFVLKYKPKNVVKEFEVMKVSTKLDPKTEVMWLRRGRDEKWSSHDTDSSKKTPSSKLVCMFPRDFEKARKKRKKARKEAMKKKLKEMMDKEKQKIWGTDYQRDRRPLVLPQMDPKVSKAISNMEELNKRIKSRFVSRPSQDEIRTFFKQYSRSESLSFEVSWDEDELADSKKKKKKKKDKKTKKVEKNKKSEKEKPPPVKEEKKEATEASETSSSRCSEPMVFMEPANSSKKTEKLEKSGKEAKKKSKSISGSGSDEVLAAQAFDYRGVPITDPLAITPFPAARSAKTRENARKMLAECGKKIKDKEDASAAAAAAKQPSEVSTPSAGSSPINTSKSSSSSACSSSTASSNASSTASSTASSSSASSPYRNPIIFKDTLNKSLRKPTRVSSNTRFPGASSPATRERVRISLKEFAMAQAEKKRKKSKGHTSSSSSAKSSSKSTAPLTGDKSSNSCASLRTIYSKSFIMSGCDKCTMCTDCITDCLEKHTDRRMLTEHESKAFLEQVARLREQFGKRLVNTRRTAASPSRNQQNSRVPTEKPE